MHKKLLRECHVSPARVTVTSLVSGISIFTAALNRYAAILPCKRVVKFPVSFVSFCSILLSFYYIYFLYPFRHFSVSSDGYGLQDRSSTP
jgi:cytochrome b subunit of formate dehydrogenase